ncbi:MAG: DUF4258 domain-containing protein [SAR202 cluster bacterium]|nr:DUF4258 domain-containing protein [SAR202 cluster bacterium]
MSQDADWINDIRKLFQADRVLYTGHCLREMRLEEFGIIEDREIVEAIESGQVIEHYPDDRPYPSVLVYGTTRIGRPIHTVCALDPHDSRVIIVTVYEPDPRRWARHTKRVKK